MGDNMFRLKDRGGRDLCLGMTEEEVMTEIARKELRSYKQLPQIWYQIQQKFRDEPRPKSGLLRVRQFTMKDSYSFDIDAAGLDVSYQKHHDVYCRIFDRCGLKYVVVQADSGAMGGSGSQEFMVYTDAGEDLVVSCPELRLRGEPREGDVEAGRRWKTWRRRATASRNWCTRRDRRRSTMCRAFLKVSRRSNKIKTLAYMADRWRDRRDRSSEHPAPLRGADARRPHAERGQALGGHRAARIPPDAGGRDVRATFDSPAGYLRAVAEALDRWAKVSASGCVEAGFADRDGRGAARPQEPDRRRQQEDYHLRNLTPGVTSSRRATPTCATRSRAKAVRTAGSR